MLEDALPEAVEMMSMGVSSHIIAGRACPATFPECLSVLKAASADDPFTNWLSTTEDVRARYLRYVLTSGFRTGWVALGRPRGGVCVATPTRTVADPCVWWAWLRFRMVLQEEHWRVLKDISASLRASSGASGVLVWYLGVVRRFRGGALPVRLLARALPEESAPPVFVQTAKPPLARVLSRRGAEEVARTALPDSALTMRLYRLGERWREMRSGGQ